MPLDPVDAPGAFARFHSEAALLGVDREHWELGLREGTWKRTHIYIYKDKVVRTLFLNYFVLLSRMISYFISNFLKS